MKNRDLFFLYLSIFFLMLFVFWTILICFVDVRAIGPNGSTVGFSTLNEFFHSFTGTNMTLYHITDYLGLIPIFIMMCFAIFGLIELIKRKSLLKVDKSIFLLGGFYIVLFLCYLFFEYVVINYRPVLIDGFLEASYPSSTTMLTICVMLSSLNELNSRIKKTRLRITINIISYLFTFFMVIGRFISGVHWFSDIIGGIFISLFLSLLFKFIHKKATQLS